MNSREYAKKQVERFTQVNSLNNAAEREFLEQMFDLAWHTGYTAGVEAAKEAMLQAFAQSRVSGAPVNGSAERT